MAWQTTAERKTKQVRDSSMNDLDLISSLPNDILHHILSFNSTDFSITTSVLSKRWRHVWSQSPYPSFKNVKASLESINKTLESYSATKITSFHLETIVREGTHLVNSMIKFAITRDVENLTLKFDWTLDMDNKFPDCFFNNSSLKQLTVEFHHLFLKSTTVSWTSLKSLTLRYVRFTDKSFRKIISGCPMLESLTLKRCDLFQYLDLSKSPHLARLDIDCSTWISEPMQIRAPHIRYLRLRTSETGCTLVDVSSLTEANLDICYYLRLKQCSEASPSRLHFLRKMLKKLLKVEKLTFGMAFLHILSLFELAGVPLPKLKVKTLVLETKLSQSVVHGIARLVQSSSGLKKITVYPTKWSAVLDKCVKSYLESQVLYPDQFWTCEVVVFPTERCDCEVAEPKHVASLMNILVERSSTLETLVVYRSGFSGKRFLITRSSLLVVLE